MKRAIALLVMAIIVAALAPLGAAAAPAGPQEEEGTIMLPSPGPNAGQGCWPGWPRRFWLFSGGATTGPMGSIIEVDKATWNGKFKLEVTSGGLGTEDLDIHYYLDLGTLDPVNDPAQQTVGTGATYENRKPGGEVGTVPAGTKYGVFCIAVGTGYNAAWKYTALPPKKKR